MPEVVAEALVALRPTMNEAETRREIKQAVDGADVPPVDIPVDDGKFKRTLTGMGNVLKGVLAFEGFQTGARLLGAVADQASDLEEAINAAQVTFNTAGDTIVDWATNNANAIGVSTSAAIEAAAAYGGMFDSLNMGDAIMADLSTAFVQLAGDLASLRNLRVDDALLKIQSGLAGEIEPLRRYGVNMSEAAVQTKAVELGLAELGDQLSQQEKLVARAAIIMEELSEAQGDAENTAEAYANSQRRLRASVQDLAAAVGGAVTPAMADFASNLAFLVDKAADATRSVGGLQSQVERLAISTPLGPLVLLNKGLSELRERFGDAGESADTYADGAEAVADAVEHLNRVNLNTAEVLEQQAAAGIEAADMDLARRQALLAVGDAQDKVTESQKALSDAQSGGGEFAEKAAAAAEKLEDAHRDLARAQQKVKELTWDLSDAQEAYAEAVFHFGPGSREARDAARDLESAQDDLSNAQEDAAETAEDLTKAQEEAARASDKTKAVEDASRDLERAQLDLETAVYRAAKAQEAFATKSEEARGKTTSEKDALILTRDALQQYADKLDGPVKTAVLNRIAELDTFIARIKEIEELTAGATFGADVPAIGAGSLAPGAISGSDLGGSGSVAGGDLGGGAVGAGSLQGSGGTTVIFQYPVPADQVGAYIEAASRTAG